MKTPNAPSIRMASGFTPKAPEPAATPMCLGERNVLATARRLSAMDRLSRGHPVSVASAAENVRHEGGSMGCSRIIEVLEAVCCKGAPDEKVQLLTQLRSLLHRNPAMCEQFFLPLTLSQTQTSERVAESSSSTCCTAWSTALQILEQSDPAELATAPLINEVLAILTTVAVQVGIGVENLRGLLGMLIRGGRWAPYSSCLLHALCSMVPSSSTATAEHSSSSDNHGSGKVFVFDGVQGGLFLGGFSSWPLETGYAFETWVWADESSRDKGRLLLRVLSNNAAAAASAAGGTAGALRAVVEVVLHAETLLIITSQSSSSRSPLKCHSKVPSKQWVHIVISHRKGGLLSRAECDVTVNGQPSTHVLPFPKVSSPSTPIKVLVACAQCDPCMEQPHIIWEKATVTLKPFKGLLQSVRFYTSPLSINDARALYTATKAQPAQTSSPCFLAVPHLLFPSAPEPWSNGASSVHALGFDASAGTARGGLLLASPHKRLSNVDDDDQPDPGKQCCLLGSAAVGGRPGILAALDCCGQMNILVSLLAATFTLPVAPQIPTPGSPAAPVTSASEDAREEHAQAPARLASQVLQLMSAVVGHALLAPQDRDTRQQLQECTPFVTELVNASADEASGGGWRDGWGGKVRSGWTSRGGIAAGDGAVGVGQFPGNWCGEVGGDEWVLQVVDSVSYVCLCAPSDKYSPCLVTALLGFIATCFEPGHHLPSLPGSLLRLECGNRDEAAESTSMGKEGGRRAETHPANGERKFSDEAGQRAVVRWILNSELWAGRGIETVLQAVQHLHSFLIHTNHLHFGSVISLLDFVLDVCLFPEGFDECGADGEKVSCPIMLHLQQRRGQSLGSPRDQLIDTLMEMCAHVCASAWPTHSNARVASSSDFEAIGHTLAYCSSAPFRARLLWVSLAVSIRDHPPVNEGQPVVRPNGWTNMLLHEMSNSSTMLAALANLVFYMASLPKHHQHRFMHLGGYTLLSRQIATAAAAICSTYEEDTSPFSSSPADASLWCRREGQGKLCAKVEPLDKEAHDTKVFNLLFDLMFFSNLYATQVAPGLPAVVLYLDAADVLRDGGKVNGSALIVLFEFLTTCSTLMRQQALNDVSLLIDKSEALRAFLVSDAPSWQGRLVRLLLRHPCASSQASSPIPPTAPTSQTGRIDSKHSCSDIRFRSFPSVVTWGAGIYGEMSISSQDVPSPASGLQDRVSDADEGASSGFISPSGHDRQGKRAERSPSPELPKLLQTRLQGDRSCDHVSSEYKPLEDEHIGRPESGMEEWQGTSALVGLVSKLLETVAQDMMLVPNGWRVLVHCIDAVRQAGLLDMIQYDNGREKGCSKTSVGAAILRGMVRAAYRISKIALQAAERWDSNIALQGWRVLQGSERDHKEVRTPEGVAPSSISMLALRDNIGGLLATVYAAEVQGVSSKPSVVSAVANESGSPVWLRWSAADPVVHMAEDNERREAIFDLQTIDGLVELIDIAFTKTGAPSVRGLQAFCAEGDSWTNRLPLASSKKTALSPALWPLSLWHMHVALLNSNLHEYTQTLSLAIAKKDPSNTNRPDNSHSSSVIGVVEAGRAEEDCAVASNWLVVDVEGSGDEECRVRNACERLLHSSSCIPVGSGESDAVLDARVASTVWSLSFWAALMLQDDDFRAFESAACKDKPALDEADDIVDFFMGDKVKIMLAEGGNKEHSKEETVKAASAHPGLGNRLVQWESQEKVLRHLLETKDSRDTQTIEWNALTCERLSQVLVGTASTLLRRNKSCQKVLNTLLTDHSASGSRLGLVSSLLGGGVWSGKPDSAVEAGRQGEAEGRDYRKCIPANLMRAVVGAQDELQVKLAGDERARSERDRARRRAEAEVAGRLLDDSRLNMLSWRTVERQRRQEVTHQRIQRALSSRKAYRRALKTACHHESIWGPFLSKICGTNVQAHEPLRTHFVPTPASAIFGENVSTFSCLWRSDEHETGGLGMRRRLKRDVHSSARRHLGYDAFLDPSPAPSSGAQTDTHSLHSPAHDSTEPQISFPDSESAAAMEMRARNTGDDRPSGIGRTRGSNEAGNLATRLVGLDVEQLVAAECSFVGADRIIPLADGQTEEGTECELVTASCIVVGCLRVSSCALTLHLKGTKESVVGVDNNEQGPVARILQRQCYRWALAQITRIEGRRYMLRGTALEISFADGSSVLLNFPGDTCEVSAAPVAQVYKHLCSCIGALAAPRLHVRYMSDPSRALAHQGLTQAWVERRISNFEYLLALNAFAGRCAHDLSQYPVMPWVLADYDSPALDLSDPSVYRDLSKPIGCQRREQEELFQERFRTWGDDEIKPFHYGSHYSTAGGVLWYLLRLEPFTSSAVHLQGGHLDCPDRLFRSIAEAYYGCTTSTTDVKELTPEFFYLPDFLVNSNGLDMGVTQQGETVGDVTLPPWAKNAADFVAIHREALESDAVSDSLHLWIDLIFGHKQRGPAAEEATNVFYYLTYEGEVDLGAIEDDVMRTAMEAQIVNFGQTPRQLFTSPHPQRLPASAAVRPFFSSSLLRVDTNVDEFGDETASSPVSGVSVGQQVTDREDGCHGHVSDDRLVQGEGSFHHQEEDVLVASADGGDRASETRASDSQVQCEQLGTLTFLTSSIEQSLIRECSSPSLAIPGPTLETGKRKSRPAPLDMVPPLHPLPLGQAKLDPFAQHKQPVALQEERKNQALIDVVQGSHRSLARSCGASQDPTLSFNISSPGSACSGTPSVASSYSMGFEGMEGLDGREACAREREDGQNSWVVKPALDIIDGSGQSAGSTSGKPAPGTTNSLFERARSNPTPRTESRSGKRKAIAGFVAGALGAVHRGLDNSPAQTVLHYVGMSSSAPTTPAAAPTPSRSPPAFGLQRVCTETLISPSVGDLDAVVFVAWSAGNQFVGADARERGREDKDSVLLAVRQSGRIVMCDIDMKSGRARARDREHKHGAKTDFPFTVSPVAINSTAATSRRPRSSPKAGFSRIPISHISTMLSSSHSNPGVSPTSAAHSTPMPRGNVELGSAGLPSLGCRYLGVAVHGGGGRGRTRGSIVVDGTDGPHGSDRGATSPGSTGVSHLVGCGQRVLLIERGPVRVVLAKGRADGSVVAWLLDARGDEASLTAMQLLPMHQDMVTAMLAVGSWHHARGMFLVTGSADCTVRITWLGNGVPKSMSALRHWAASPLPPQPLHVLHGHRCAVTCLAASASLDLIVSADAAGGCFLFHWRMRRLRQGCMVQTIRKGSFVRSFSHPYRLPILLLQLSAFGDIFMCGEGDSGIYISDLHGLALLHVPFSPPHQVFRRHPQQRGLTVEEPLVEAAISCMLLSDDGALLITGDVAGQVVVRAARCLRVLRVLTCAYFDDSRTPRTGAVVSMAFSPSNNFLLVGTELGHVQVFLADTFQPLAEPPS